MQKDNTTIEQIYYVVLPLIRRAGQMLIARQKGITDLGAKALTARLKEITEEVEQFAADTLQQLFPEHAVLGKETNSKQKAEWQWIITPLDGVGYYRKGLPQFATSLALRQKGEVVLGVVVRPTLDGVFYAMKDGGAFYNNRSIQVSDKKDLSESIIYVAAPVDSDKTSALQYKKIVQSVVSSGARVTDLGLPSLGLCYVAAGMFDALMSSVNNATLLQHTAGLLIAREAGARLSDINGKPLGGGAKPTNLLAVTGGLEKKLITSLK